MKFNFSRLAVILPAAGILTIALGVSLSMLFYNSTNREHYSVMNHFISELGWLRKSKMAWLFNASVVLGNILITPGLIALGCRINTKLAYVATSAGVFTAISGCAVGIITMDRLIPHINAAVLFFWGWMFTVIFFTLSIFLNLRDRRFRLMLIPGVTAIITIVIFFVLPKGTVIEALKHIDSFKRPEFWPVPMCEWLVLASQGFWLLTASFLLWREEGVAART